VQVEGGIIHTNSTDLFVMRIYSNMNDDTDRYKMSHKFL